MKARKVMAILTAVCMSVSMAGVVSAAEENSGADPSTICLLYTSPSPRDA